MIKSVLLAAAWSMASACLAHAMPEMGHGGPGSPPAADAGPPVIVDGLGDAGYEAGTAIAAARAQFDNGVRLNNIFNEQEAVRAFKSAQQLDPDCAMCFWGEASALAPTINYTISPETAGRAAALLDHAQELAFGLSELGRGIIAAERARYVPREGGWSVDDAAAAGAAEALADRFPFDDAVQSFAANADLIAAEHGRPGSAKAGDPFLASAGKRLDLVLSRTPDFTPALHLSLHLLEWQGHPERAAAYADRLGPLAPESGHMLHMASHIYYHTGRYEDAALANFRAAAADADYVAKVAPPGGMAALPMHGHNLEFGLNGALLSGDGALALKFAREMQQAYPPESRTFARAYLAYGRFLPVEEMLALPPPPASLAAAFYHYARGDALARAGDAKGVSKEAAAIAALQAHGRFGVEDPRVVAMIGVARLTLAGRAGMVGHQWPVAIANYRKAALFAEQNEPFGDPPLWPWSPRRSLAAALLAAGRPGAARKEAEAALRSWPGDPAILHILTRAPARGRAWMGSPDLLDPASI